VWFIGFVLAIFSNNPKMLIILSFFAYLKMTKYTCNGEARRRNNWCRILLMIWQWTSSQELAPGKPLCKDRGVWNLPFVGVIREGNAMADQLARQPVNHCGWHLGSQSTFCSLPFLAPSPSIHTLVFPATLMIYVIFYVVLIIFQIKHVLNCLMKAFIATFLV